VPSTLRHFITTDLYVSSVSDFHGRHRNANRRN